MFDRDAYLIRIGYQGRRLRPWRPWGLHRAHVMTVPFENLNIHLGRPVSGPLRPVSEDCRRATGVDLFRAQWPVCALLEDIGFTVTRLAAQVLYGTEGMRPRSHQLLLVHLGEERWLADVGFGGQGLREPFLSWLVWSNGRTGSIQARDRRTEKSLCCNGTWRKPGSISILCARSLVASGLQLRKLLPLAPPGLFSRNSASVPMPTPEGRTSLIDNVLKVRGRRQAGNVMSPMRSTKQLLQQHFRIDHSRAREVLTDHLSELTGRIWAMNSGPRSRRSFHTHRPTWSDGRAPPTVLIRGMSDRSPHRRKGENTHFTELSRMTHMMQWIIVVFLLHVSWSLLAWISFGHYSRIHRIGGKLAPYLPCAGLPDHRQPRPSPPMMKSRTRSYCGTTSTAPGISTSATQTM